MARPSKLNRKEVTDFLDETFKATGKTPTYKELVRSFGSSTTTHLQILTGWEQKRNSDNLRQYLIEPSMVQRSLTEAVLPVINSMVELRLCELAERKKTELEEAKYALSIAYEEHAVDQEKIEELKQKLMNKERELAQNCENMLNKMALAYEQFNKEKDELQKQMTDMKVHYEVQLAQQQNQFDNCSRHYQCSKRN